MNWDKLVATERELAMMQEYMLQADWQEQTAAYPKSKLSIADWPSMDAHSNDHEGQSTKGTFLANEGASANKGECSSTTETAASTNDMDSDDGTHHESHQQANQPDKTCLPWIQLI